MEMNFDLNKNKFNEYDDKLNKLEKKNRWTKKK
jgi:hypothetical protein